ncbi:gastrula zinc finger protein XlCGF26.1-like [Copidosoma floridanum]|uniref:gastrula zinc finger protein XlCGF26.1-like n=1 Tax=Copidosoma floridanum TaxID=29053 RepID=UPI0006C9D60C|nr:gastrula zinc finger protein XlCGF26.1-like [Copidosoma floridanum]XP_014203919.1 gastrula zinc finger protein XlCGF26.1-like [Copidosoma floridanum]
MKEEKVEYDIISTDQAGTMTLADSQTIHLGPILAPGSTDTISIVIPLSAQLALSRNIQQQVICKPEPIENTEKKVITISKPKTNPPRIKEDKTKGCPYPNCSRYGKAFSRAHDLKRHIARHETRENKETEMQDQQVYPCLVCGAQFYNETILQRHKQIHENGTNSIITSTSGPPYTCNFCKKTFEDESLLHAHLPTHIKSEPIITFENTTTPTATAEIHYQTLNSPTELLTTTTVPVLATTSASSIASDDDYRLEDMLLLRKSSHQKPLNSASTSSTSPSAASKIRCEYCSKTFKTKWTLSSHVAAHEGRFQYQCCICNKRFVRKSHYESHVRSHDAARPFVCEHCGKTFKESKHRREHLKRKHPTNRNAIQSLLDSISACVNEETAVAATEQTKQQFTILMPMNFST